VSDQRQGSPGGLLFLAALIAVIVLAVVLGMQP
jgi:hypothetical protein